MSPKSRYWVTERDNYNRNMQWLLPYAVSVAFLVVLVFYIKGRVDFTVLLFLIIIVIINWVRIAIVWYHFRYVVDNYSIMVMIGPLCIFTIDLNQIAKINLKRRSLGISGLSNDTISIILNNKKEISISPVNKFDFIKFLLELRPDIEIDDKIKTIMHN